MEAIGRPLRRLVSALQWFVVAEELRLLQVVVSEDLRIAALEHIAAQEHDAANRRPFFVLEAPVDEGDDGWRVRADELRADMAELTALLARADPPLALAAMPPRAAGSTRAGGFALELKAALGCLREPLTGLVVVLAPAWLRAPRPWLEDLRALVDVPSLARVRWILVEADGAHASPMVDALGPRAERVEVLFDPEEAREELRSGGGVPGVVGPRHPPPVRRGAPAPLPPEALALVAPGVPTGLLDPAAAARLRDLVLGAAREMAGGHTGDAARRLREAAELARTGGLAKEALVLDLLQGSHALQQGAASVAARVFEQARKGAAAAGFADVAVQAQLAIAAALLAERKPQAAAAAYAEAGRAGAEAGIPALAIEAYRTCGQLLLSLGDAREATRVWTQALALAGALPEELRSRSSAPEVARALAALCRRHGLTAQAASLEAQAKAFEDGGGQAARAGAGS